MSNDEDVGLCIGINYGLRYAVRVPVQYPYARYGAWRDMMGMGRVTDARGGAGGGGGNAARRAIW